ncbi:Reverse transcriptase domain-containing protein [Hirschfeldia incana]|nr:Reverse transcriptase domain-containing protein [Hirschfeldia incana]
MESLPPLAVIVKDTRGYSVVVEDEDLTILAETGGSLDKETVDTEELEDIQEIAEIEEVGDLVVERPAKALPAKTKPTQSIGFPPFTGKPSLRFLTHRVDKNKKLRNQKAPSEASKSFMSSESTLPLTDHPSDNLSEVTGDDLEEGEIPFMPSPAAVKKARRVVLANQSWNAIRYLRDSTGLRIYNQQQIKGMSGAYFKNLLGSESRGIQSMSVKEIMDVHPFRCSSLLAEQLTLIPSDEEIKHVFFKMPKCKAPGPDGFLVELFLDAWDIVGIEATQAVKEFFTSGRMLRKFNATTIALIPKFTGADELSKFKPVSFQNNQAGFIKGRLLCENVLLASELVTGFHKRGITTRGCLQIDFMKAYDNLNWEFMLNILYAFNLPATFINWIKECITTTSFSIVFNGELLECFSGRKGLRQGDPISSLLFVLAMDILSKLLHMGATYYVFGLHPKCNAPLITHISFADDVLLFFDGTDQSLQGLLSILNDFNRVYGLGINRSKTAVFFDGGNMERNRSSAISHGLAQGSFPVYYLGVPFTTKAEETELSASP